MNKKTNILSSLAAAAVLSGILTSGTANAGNIYLELFNNQISITDQGSDVSSMHVAIGYWATGFTPTAGNISSWFSNFYGWTSANPSSLLQGGSHGYYIRDDAPDLSVGINVGDNSTGAQYSAVAPPTTQLSVIGLNLAAQSNPTSYASATRGFILTDNAWRVPLTDLNNLTTPVPLSLSANTTITSSIGSFSLVSGGPSVIALGAIPEPSTGALMMIGAVGLVALRRLRKV